MFSRQWFIGWGWRDGKDVGQGQGDDGNEGGERGGWGLEDGVASDGGGRAVVLTSRVVGRCLVASVAGRELGLVEAVAADATSGAGRDVVGPRGLVEDCGDGGDDRIDV